MIKCYNMNGNYLHGYDFGIGAGGDVSRNINYVENIKRKGKIAPY